MVKAKKLTAKQIELLKDMYKVCADDLIKELSKIENKSRKSIVYGGCNLSVDELNEEIKNMTPFGIEHVILHLEVLCDHAE